MELDWTTNIVIGLISTLVVFAVSTWSSKGPPDKRGWIKLQPGALYQFAVVGGTLFTLFVLPAFYLYLARDHAHDRQVEAEVVDALPPPEPQHG